MSRLGLLGGTTGRAGADTRSPDEAAEAIASPESRRRAASGLIETHDAVFRRTARRYSICADDAEDAYQRALEILLTKAPPIEGDSLVRWMQTVTKREALACEGSGSACSDRTAPPDPMGMTSGTRSIRSRPRARGQTIAWRAASEWSEVARRSMPSSPRRSVR